jgi:DNA-binding transcriptional LysR family regulator
MSPRGFSRNVVHEVDSIYTALALVAAGVGISLVPASLQDGRSKDIVFRELQGRVPRVDEGLPGTSEARTVRP